MSLTVGLRAYRTPFARPIATGRGLWTHREGAWVVVRDEQGLVGLGEIAPLPDWGTEPLEAAMAALPRMGPPVFEIDEYWLDPDAWGVDPARTPAAWAGLELALLDLEGRRSERSVAEVLADSLGTWDPESSVPVNALLVAESPASLADEAARAAAAGYRAVKLKVGARSLEAELARVEAARAAIGPSVALRLDANGGWSREEARAALLAFAPSAIDYVEQPVAVADREGLVWLERETGVTVAADEAANDHDAVEACLKAGVSVLVLKPVAHGGLVGAGVIAERARALGARVVLTSALDRGLATLGTLHLAAALGLDEPMGLATGGMFDPSAIDGFSIEQGSIALSDSPGLGAVVRDADLKEAADG